MKKFVFAGFAVVLALSLPLASASAGLIKIVNLKSLPKSAPNNVNSYDDLIPVFGADAVTAALGSIGLSASDLASLDIDVSEGSSLGNLEGSKSFDLQIAPGEFVTIKYGTYVALYSNAGERSRGVSVTIPKGLSNIRRFRGDPVPEPASIAAFGAGALIVGWAIRRRRKTGSA